MPFPSWFLRITRFSLDTLFPPLCVNCRAHLTDSRDILCGTCSESIHLRTSLFCGTCMRRLPEARKVCHLDTPYILGAAGAYDDPALKALIHALKYEKIERAASFLGNSLVRYVEATRLDTTHFSVIPVPLSKKRLRERGFNQAELIAKVVAAHFQIPLDTSSLLKSMHTKPQMGLARAEREKNLIGCFEARNRREIKGKNIILIDDVSTSGATLSEAARVLRNAGAKKIIGLVVAKA